MTTRQGLLRLFVSLMAIASLCIGIGGYIGYARLGSVAGQATFLSPWFSTAVLFCGAGLYAARSYPRYARCWALTVAGTIILARLAPDWSPAWVNGRSLTADFATAVILAGAAIALILPRRTMLRRLPPIRNERIVALGCVAVSTLIALALIEENIITNQRFALNSATAIAQDVQDRTSRAAVLTRRLSERWSAIDHMPTTAFMEAELDSFVREYPFFLALAAIAPDGTLKVERNRDGRRPDWIQNLAAHDDGGLHRWLELVHATGQTHFVVTDRVWENVKAQLIIAPLFNPAMQNWTLLACLELADIVTWAMSRSDEDGYIRISHAGHTLYQNDLAPSGPPIAAGNVAIPVHDGVELNLYYYYTAADISVGTEAWAEFVWLAGIIFTFFLIWSQRLTSVARLRAAQLSHNALHDPLTGLPNRRALHGRLKRACARARRQKHPVSVVFFDLDGIRFINDTIDHDAGDAVLKEIAQRLKGASRDDGTVTQLGAAEFVLLFVGHDLSQVQTSTQRIITRLSSPYHIHGRTMSMVVSAGIATSDGHIDDPMQLVRQADLAMQQAKQQGHNTWQVYTQGLSTRMAERLELRHDLRHALEADTLTLHYQPIVEGPSRRVVAMEVLARWNHPTHGPISPGYFIPLAEETGEIVDLTNWVLASACRDCASLQRRGLRSIPISVNISPLYFQRANFVADIRRALRDGGLQADLLMLEITESVLLDNEEDAILKLAQLRKMGIRTAIDDFGTGYSSLSSVKKLPIDTIKIDRSFVTDIVNDTTDQALTRGIISMAHHLGLVVVVEGVETEAQFELLLQQGCDRFQGYLFARPMPFEQWVATIRDDD